MIVVITGPAAADLRAIGDYISRDSLAQAAKVVAGLRHTCATLSEASLRFPLAPQLGEGVRRVARPPYVVFYRVGDEVVEVLRIIHAARDYGQLPFVDD
jgi:toxin ParE1/3/4